jgi:hypothetical protein
MVTQTTVLIFAILAAFGLLAIVAVDTVLTTQRAEAQGCINPHAPGGGIIAFNASQGRCAVGGGPP